MRRSKRPYGISSRCSAVAWPLHRQGACGCRSRSASRSPHGPRCAPAATPGNATVDLNLIPISDDVDGRFPARLRLDGAAEAEELALQPLRLLQHFARFGPHPGRRVTDGHERDPCGTWRVRGVAGGRVNGFDYETSAQITRQGRGHRRGRGPDLGPAAGRHLPQPAGQAGRHLRRRHPDGAGLRQCPVHPADPAGGGLPGPAGDAGGHRARCRATCSPTPWPRWSWPPAATSCCRCSPVSGSRSRATRSRCWPPTVTGWR